MIRVEINRIVDNRFQTRTVYGDVGELAASLLHFRETRRETSGLIQVPPGRVVLRQAQDDMIADKWGKWQILDPAEYGGVAACLGDEPEAVVELAAGHRRLLAFRQLVEAGEAEYGTFPVEVQVLDDQAMADIAWEENSRRKDLTAIEEAEALKRAMEEFGWTQKEVGERWGLSQPAVGNKLRLLGLPEEAQEAIRAGEIGERHGRVLLQGMKSERIYERLAAEVIPPRVEETTAARARAMAGGQHFYKAHLAGEQAGAVCGACGKEADKQLVDGMFYTATNGAGERVFLCHDCLRAGTEWEVPSVAEVEKELEHIVNANSRALGNADFPLDVEIGVGDERIQAGKCIECQVREERGHTDWCLDVVCFKLKKEKWYGHLVIELQERIKRQFGMYGEKYKIHQEYSGYDLKTNDEVDVALVREGICAPGKCERVQFRRPGYEATCNLKPYDDLPFIYQCNNTNSHRACQRRYLAGQRTEEDVETAKATEEAEKERKKVGLELVERAELSVARALREGQDGAWWSLAQKLGAKVKPGQPVEASARQVAELLVRGRERMGWFFWEKEETEAHFEKEIREHMERLGVRMLLGAGEVERKLERMSEFVVNLNRGDPSTGSGCEVTAEMIAGNLDNLTALGVVAAEMLGDGRVDEGGYERVMGWIGELREQLGDISREMGG